MYRELRALVPRTRSDQSRRVYFSEHFKREYRLVRGELSRFLIINQSCEKLRLLFLPTLLSYSSRFLCALQQNRAHSRPLFLLTNVESYNNSIGIVSVSVWENPSPSILLSCLIKEETWFWPNKDFISANLKYENVLPTRFEILKIRFTIKCAKISSRDATILKTTQLPGRKRKTKTRSSKGPPTPHWYRRNKNHYL